MKLLRILFACSLLFALGCDSEEKPGETNTASEEEEKKAEPKEADDPAEQAEAGGQSLDLPNASEPIHGLIAAGQPSQEQFKKLRENGFRAVINLRTEEEVAWDEKREAIIQKIGYAHIPIGGPEDLTEAKVKEFDEALSQAPSDAKVLVHCGSSNRVGAMLALRANWEQDASPEEALALGKKAGLTSLEDAVKAKLKTHEKPEGAE